MEWPLNKPETGLYPKEGGLIHIGLKENPLLRASSRDWNDLNKYYPQNQLIASIYTKYPKWVKGHDNQ